MSVPTLSNEIFATHPSIDLYVLMFYYGFNLFSGMSKDTLLPL